MADITVPVGGKTDFKLLFKDQGSGIYAPAVSLIGGGGGGSTTFAGLTDRVPFVNPTAGLPAMQVQAAAAQSAELWDFLDPGGTARVTVGSLFTLSDSTLILGSVPSQTGPVLNVQNSGGTTVLQIEPSGRISTPAVTDLSIRAGTGGDVLIGSGAVNVIDVQGSQILLLQAVRASAANAIALVVRGATSQTSDLQTWNDGTGNTVLAGVNAVGGLRLVGSDTASKLLVAPSGTATVAGNDAMIQCNADACKALLIRGFSGTQSGNLTEWQTSAGTLQSGVDPAGRFGIGVAPSATQRLTVQTSNAAHKAAVIVAAAAQTASLLELQDSGAVARVVVGSLTATGDATLVLRAIGSQTGNMLTCFASDGTTQNWAVLTGGGQRMGAYSGVSASTTGLGVFGNSEFQNDLVVTRWLGLGQAIVANQRVTLNTGGGANKGIVAIAGASQTGSMQEWQDTGAVARVVIGSLTAVGDHTLTLRAIGSQTGRLLACQDSAGALLGYISAAATVVFNTYTGTTGVGSLAMTASSALLGSFTSGATGQVVLRAVGFAGQTADLFRGVDSSGNINAFIDATGAGAFKPRDAATNTITTGLTMGHNSSGTPAAGFGGQMQFLLQSSTTADRAVGEQSFEWVVATDASRTARAKFTVYDTAAREFLRGEASGSAAMVGFLGSTAVVRQAGASAAGIAAITDASAKAAITALQAALAAYGLVTSPA